MKKYLLAVLVDNKPGVLTHVSGLISRRAFNIESISAGYTEEPDVTRINIVVSVESEGELDQVIQQLSKLIDVIKIVNLSEEDAIERELVLIKVAATREAGMLRLCYATLKPTRVRIVVTNADPKARTVKEPVERTVELPPTWGWATFGTYDVPIAGINRLVNVRLEGLGEPFALDWIQLVHRPRGR